MRKVITWVDVESAGTSSAMDQLLEVAAVLTDFDGNPLQEPYSALVTVSNLTQVIENSDPTVKAMHERSGLWGDLWRCETKPPEVIDQELQKFLLHYVDDSLLLFGGNSPHLDRSYNELYLPGFNSMLSHRGIDVTTLSMVLQEHGKAQMFLKESAHRALPDVWDCITEYRHYLDWVRAH